MSNDSSERELHVYHRGPVDWWLAVIPLAETFDEVYEDGEYLKARCCGSECNYKSGIVGTDMAECRTCGARVVNLPSLHVSPLLISGSATHMPTAELVSALGGREWWVVTA